MFTKAKLFVKKENYEGNFEFQRFYTKGGELAGILVMNWCVAHFLFVEIWATYSGLKFLYIPNLSFSEFLILGLAMFARWPWASGYKSPPLLKQLFLNSWEPSHVPCPPIHTCVSVILMCLATSPSIPPIGSSRRLLQMDQGIHGRQALVMCLKLKTASPSIQNNIGLFILTISVEQGSFWLAYPLI